MQLWKLRHLTDMDMVLLRRVNSFVDPEMGMELDKLSRASHGLDLYWGEGGEDFGPAKDAQRTFSIRGDGNPPELLLLLLQFMTYYPNLSYYHARRRRKRKSFHRVFIRTLLSSVLFFWLYQAFRRSRRRST